jgi:hypothetical protein
MVVHHGANVTRINALICSIQIVSANFVGLASAANALRCKRNVSKGTSVVRVNQPTPFTPSLGI